MKYIIGCDADGVLTDLSTHNLRAGKKAFDRDPVHPDTYALEEMFDVSDIPKWKQYVKAFGIYHRYCKYEPPREGAAEVISTLSQQRFEFHAITARKFATDRNPLGKMARDWFETWLKTNGIHFQAIHYCGEIHSHKDKLLACHKLGVDAMIEDRPDNAMYLAENGIHVLMFDAPYNQDTVHKNITRVTDWSEVKKVLESLPHIEENSFVKLTKEEVECLSEAEKVSYFHSYQRHLQSLPFDESQFRKGDRRFHFLYRMIKLPAKLFFHVSVFGKENIPYQDGFILACNHCDSSDQYRLGLAIGNRAFVGYAAKEIEKSFRGRLFSYTELGLFIDRKNATDKQEASERMASYVAHDRISMIFPEGTRKNKTPEGKMRFMNRFKPGTASLAQKTGAGILPIAINSFGRTAYVRFGEMIYVSGSDSVAEKTALMEHTIAGLCMENINQYYAKYQNTAALKAEKEKYEKYLKEIEK